MGVRPGERTRLAGSQTRAELPQRSWAGDHNCQACAGAAALIEFAQRRKFLSRSADVYRLTTAGHAAFRDWRLRQLR